MKIRTPKFYKDFKCIAGDCPDSCCQGWEVDADEQSLKFYETLNGEIKNRIDSVLDKDEFGNTIFRLSAKKRCPFLNEQNLCDMHIAIGGEHTPFTCRTFPRFINNFGSLREIGISFSCPVAADMMFDLKDGFTFCQEENDLPPTLNDIDAQLYFKLLNARKEVFNILQNRTVSLKKRLTDILLFSNELQNEIGEYQQGSDDVDFLSIFDNPELINEEWKEKVNHPNICSIEDSDWGENIASYFIYKYFLMSVSDGDVLSVAKMAVVGVILTNYFGADSWTIHLWSKETEHSDVNMNRYKSLLKTANSLSTDSLISRINM